MTEIDFGVRLPPCGPATDLAAFAATVEDAGFTTAWFPDSQFLFRDVWVTMALAAQRTRTLTLGTAVTNFETRHVSVTAAATASVEELAPGRVRVAVGSGETAVKTIGLPRTAVARMDERLSDLRALLGRRGVSFGAGGEFEGMKMRVSSASGRAVPLYLAATGPRMLRLAGARADGVMILAGSSPELISRAVRLVREGADAAGRPVGEVDIGLAAHTAVSDDPTTAVRQVKPMVVQSSRSGASGALERIGIELHVPPQATEEIYPALGHAEDWDAAIAYAGQWVSDDMAARYAQDYALVGTPGSVAARLREAVELGVTSFYTLDLRSYELPRELVKVMSERVIPQVRGTPETAPAERQTT